MAWELGEQGTMAQWDLVSAWLQVQHPGGVGRGSPGGLVGGEGGPCRDKKQATSAGFCKDGTAGAASQTVKVGMGSGQQNRQGSPGNYVQDHAGVPTDQLLPS